MQSFRTINWLYNPMPPVGLTPLCLQLSLQTSVRWLYDPVFKMPRALRGTLKSVFVCVQNPDNPHSINFPFVILSFSDTWRTALIYRRALCIMFIVCSTMKAVLARPMDLQLRGKKLLNNVRSRKKQSI